jgi:hypothetical protein
MLTQDISVCTLLRAEFPHSMDFGLCVCLEAKMCHKQHDNYALNKVIKQILSENITSCHSHMFNFFFSTFTFWKFLGVRAFSKPHN